MYFNIWNNYFYWKISLLVILSIFITIFFISYILTKWIWKFFKNKEEKDKVSILIEWKNAEEKFNILRDLLNLNSSYQLANFINLKEKEIENLIKQNELEKIVNLILKNI